jgi:hypothetical protein
MKVTKEQVLAYMTEHTGSRFQCSRIGTHFGVPSKEIRPILDILINEKEIFSGVVGNSRVAFVLSEKEIKEKNATAEKNEIAEKLRISRQNRTLKRSPEWMNALERTKELYSDGHTIKAMGSNVRNIDPKGY